jgi:hypothetical protein
VAQAAQIARFSSPQLVLNLEGVWTLVTAWSLYRRLGGSIVEP